MPTVTVDMAVPDFQSFMLPVMQIMADKQPHSMAELRGLVPGRMEISEEDRAEMLPSGLKTRCEDRINWSVTYLFQAKLLERPRRGVYHVSQRGLELLAKDPEKITVPLLNQYPEFVEFYKMKHDDVEIVDPVVDGGPAVTQTPEERLESGFRELNDALAAELLNLVKESSPEFFERLVVRLLVAMGYGGSIQDAGKAVGRAGDGGIDGIIKEDKLGLDNVYLQAKRYTEQNIGSRIVREFIGSLTLKRARKGVLITTSTFSAEAVACVESIDQRIVLIDGRLLAELMIEHNVGVGVSKTYQIKKLDQDFFDGE